MITLLASASASLFAGALYASLCASFAKRAVESEERAVPVGAFAAWWGALAAYSFLQAAFLATLALDLADVALVQTFATTSIVSITVAIWGAATYFGYVVTGRNVAWPLAAYFAWLTVVLLYAVNAIGIDGASAGAWAPVVRYGAPLDGPVPVVLSVLLLAPVLVGAVAFLHASRRVATREQRSRMIAVALGLVLWAVGGSVAELSADPLWQFATGPLLALGVAVGLTFAIRPPGSRKGRTGIAN